MKDIIYLDNASTTPLKKEVLDAMTPYLTKFYGNANSVHQVGRDAVKGLDFARETVADIIGANFNEIYFTSGGTESNNLAIRGAYYAQNKNKFVTTSIEHLAVLQTAIELEKQGVETIKIKPNSKGIVSASDFNIEDVKDAFLVSVMLANNEIGTYQPVKEISEICKSQNTLFFTDAVQAMGAMDINVKELGVDMLSFSGHKFGGPKGVGVLYVKNGINISPQITGGHQERSRRGGTSNVAGAVGLATALKLSRENLSNNAKSLTYLRNYFISEIAKSGVDFRLNGDSENRLPNNANLTFFGVDGEALLYALDLNGVCASLGSACSSGESLPSYVLKEIGLSDSEISSTIRFTLSNDNDKAQIDRAVKIISECVKNLKK